jgi:hypothetical protein
MMWIRASAQSRRPVGRALFKACVLLQCSTAFAQTPAQVIQEDSLEASLSSLIGGIDLIRPLTVLTRVEVSRLPLGTSTGGLTFRFDPTKAVPTERLAPTLGSIFTDRATTVGRSQVVLGVNYFHTVFSSLGGLDLRSGELRPFRNLTGTDFTSSVLSLKMSSDSVVPFALFGVTDKIDVGLATPWVRVKVFGQYNYLDEADRLRFVNALLPQSESGLGDIALLGKFRFWTARRRLSGDNRPPEGAPGGGAVGVEVRLPTGNEAGLRGLGVTRTRVDYIVSFTAGKWSPHANIGYESWSRGLSLSKFSAAEAKDGMKIAGGTEWAVRPRTTLSFDLLATALMNGGEVKNYRINPAGTEITGEELLASSGVPMLRLDLAPGIRWNPWRNLLLSASVLIPLHNLALGTSPIPMIGLEWVSK